MRRRTWSTVTVSAAIILALGLVNRASAFPLTVSGKITAVDPAGRTFTMQTGLLAATEFHVSSETVIAEGPEAKPFETLQPGDRVTVEYERGEGARVAQVIRVREKTGEASLP